MVFVLVSMMNGALVSFSKPEDFSTFVHVGTYVAPHALGLSLLNVLLVLCLTFVFGGLPAWVLHTYRLPWPSLIETCHLLALAMPSYFLASIAVDVFSGTSWGVPFTKALRSPWGLSLIQGLALSPYVFVGFLLSLRLDSLRAAEASEVLGRSPKSIFFQVVLPLSRPALIGAFILVALEVLNDYGTASLLGQTTVVVLIYDTWAAHNSLGAALQFSCLVLLVVFALVATEYHLRQRVPRHFRQGPHNKHCPKVIPIVRQIFGFVVCLLPPLLGWVLPSLFLIIVSFHTFTQRGFSRDLYQAWVTSSYLAFISAFLGVVFAFFICVGVCQHSSSGRLWLKSLCMLGYGIPGTLLALGLLTPMVALDQGLRSLLEWLGQPFHFSSLMLSGTALVLAYLMKFQAVGYHNLDATLAKIPRNIDRVVQLAGLSPFQAQFLIYAPLLRRSLAASGLLIFIDTLKELPATLLLAPFNMVTLAVHGYSAAGRGVFEEGAPSMLVLISMSGFATLLFRYLISHR